MTLGCSIETCTRASRRSQAISAASPAAAPRSTLTARASRARCARPRRRRRCRQADLAQGSILSAEHGAREVAGRRRAAAQLEPALSAKCGCFRASARRALRRSDREQSAEAAEQRHDPGGDQRRDPAAGQRDRGCAQARHPRSRRAACGGGAKASSDRVLTAFVAAHDAGDVLHAGVVEAPQPRHTGELRAAGHAQRASFCFASASGRGRYTTCTRPRPNTVSS